MPPVPESIALALGGFILGVAARALLAFLKFKRK